MNSLQEPVCSINDCENIGQLRKGWCEKHYRRHKKYGNPLFTKIREYRKSGMSDKELRIWIRFPPQSKKDPNTGCREWQGLLNLQGYGVIGYDGKSVLVHRLAWALKYKSWPENMLLHSCDNSKCINIKHLREGSQQDNMNDMMNRNRHARLKGEDHGSAKLTEKQVIKIRKKYKTGRYTQKKLGEMYGITNANVSEICSKKSWKHIP